MTQNNLQIEINDIRKIAEILLSHLEDMGYQQVEISHQYYWHIPKEDIYTPNDKPSRFSLGEFSYEWSLLRKMLENEDEAIGYGLVWLGALLRNIGERYSL